MHREKRRRDADHGRDRKARRRRASLLADPALDVDQALS